MDTYPELLKYLDILCPFGFARMPATDISGKEAADLLQKVCDEANAHLWFDLEAFLFNPDNSLYPRPIEQIIHDLNLFDNFEKILCYQSTIRRCLSVWAKRVQSTCSMGI